MRARIDPLALSWLRHVFADGGYANEKLCEELKYMGEWTVEIIKRSDTAQGFEVLSRRWVANEFSDGSAALVDMRRIAKQPWSAPLRGTLVTHICIHTSTRKTLRSDGIN